MPVSSLSNLATLCTGRELAITCLFNTWCEGMIWIKADIPVGLCLAKHDIKITVGKHMMSQFWHQYRFDISCSYHLDEISHERFHSSLQCDNHDWYKVWRQYRMLHSDDWVYLVLSTDLDSQFGSGSLFEPNQHQIVCPGGEYPRRLIRIRCNRNPPTSLNSTGPQRVVQGVHL